MNTRRPLVLVAVLAICLTGCVPRGAEPVVTVRPSAPGDSSTPAPSRSTSGTAADCGGEPVAITGGRDLVLVGDCPLVTISGAQIELDLTGARLGEVAISGDRNELDVADAAAVTIAGQANDVDAAAIGVLTINGDRNEIDAAGAIGTVAVNGNDNEVEAGSLDGVVDNGTGNEIRVDR